MKAPTLVVDLRFEGGFRVDSPADGSVYTLVTSGGKPYLIQRPALKGGGFEDGPDDGGDVAWDCIEERWVPYLRGVEAMLTKRVPWEVAAPGVELPEPFGARS